MFRAVPVLALVLAVVAACDRDPEQPRGDVWEPCTEDRRCSAEGNLCQQVWGASDVTYCAPTCSWGTPCGAPPPSDDGLTLSARCTATQDSPAGLCVIDCATGDNCPAGMLCFFDETYTLSTDLGICAWPPL